MSKRVKRFFYVTSLRSRTMHIMDGRHHSEGKTRCGRNATPEWAWCTGGSLARRKPRCTQCQNA